MDTATRVFILLAMAIGIEGRARSSHGGSSCKPTQVSPGVWNFTCATPADEKITLNLEHIVQFKNSDLTDNVGPKEINVDVPNYKIRQVIRPQIVEEEGVNSTSLKVNIQLLTPDIQTDRQEELIAGQRGTPQPPPVVHIKYPQIGDMEANFRDPKIPT